jgi:hypothetical protein
MVEMRFNFRTFSSYFSIPYRRRSWRLGVLFFGEFRVGGMTVFMLQLPSGLMILLTGLLFMLMTSM